MWSFVGKKAQNVGYGTIIDHTGRVILAYVCGTHEDEIFLQLKEYLDHLGSHAFTLTTVEYIVVISAGSS